MNRLSINDLFDHPWICDVDETDNDWKPENKHQYQILKNLKKYNQTMMFQKEILSVLFQLKINQREHNKLYELFERYDDDKSGLLSKSEIAQMKLDSKMENYNDLNWLRYIEYCDFDGDNEINQEEFLFAFINSKVKFHQQNLRKIF